MENTTWKPKSRHRQAVASLNDAKLILFLCSHAPWQTAGVSLMWRGENQFNTKGKLMNLFGA